MKFTKSLSFLAVFCMAFFISCQQETDLSQDVEISPETLSKIHALGFGTKNVKKIDEGYLVEGDIVLTLEYINSKAERQLLRVGAEEQYHTTNLVTGLPRNITVSISNRLPSSYVAALNEALTRFNNEGLRITFSLVSSNADISITKASRGAQYLASAGFPTSSGQPHNSIRVNSAAIGNQPQSTVATILAHEIGHCIGFRHTDYMSRQYSCGGSPVNEGDGGVGAIYIPGTATGPDPNSWMLACIGSGQNRPFNNNDKTALAYLY
jgi:Dual-action HEIGH metallo-peptidase